MSITPTFDLSLDGIPYRELNEGSGRMQFGSNQNAVRRLMCLWTNGVKLALRLRGWRQTSSILWNPTYAQQHPSNIGLYCTDVSLRPAGKPTGENTWELAVLDVTYLPVLQNIYIGPAQVPAYDLLDEQLDFSADMASLGKTGWTYDDDASAVQQNTVSVLVPQIAYSITQYHVTRLPVSTIYATMGCLNLTTFRGAASGKMLYLGAQANRKIVGTFQNQTYYDWTVMHKFLVSSRNLNAETNPATGVDTGITGGGGRKKFTFAEFANLGLGVTYA